MSRLGEKYTFWACTSHKKTNCPSCSSGTIREDVLKEECAKVLGTPEFDEDIFSERVERITVPETGTMIFEFTDGTTLEHHWYRNTKKESWTEENRKRASQYRRRHPVTRDDITCFTTKIRCEEYGCNYRKQTCVMADGHQNVYWKCADKKNHPGKSLREDPLKEIINEFLGLDEFDEQVFLERIDHISVRDLTHLTFHFTDGSTAERNYEFRKEGVPWTDEAGKSRPRPSGTASRQNAGRKSAKT